MFTVARWWGPLLAYMSFIFFMSANPSPATFDDTPDYVLHAGGYFLLALLAIRAFNQGITREPTRASLVAAVVFAVLYGMSDEWHQAYVPGRHSSLGDVAADAGGSLLAAAALGLFWKLRGVSKSE